MDRNLSVNIPYVCRENMVLYTIILKLYHSAVKIKFKKNVIIKCTRAWKKCFCFVVIGKSPAKNVYISRTCYDNVPLYTAVPHPSHKCFLKCFVTKYVTVNLGIISRSRLQNDFFLWSIKIVNFLRRHYNIESEGNYRRV